MLAWHLGPPAARFRGEVHPHAVEAAPPGPFYQQTFDHHIVTPCLNVPEPAVRSGPTEEVLPPATSDRLRRGAGRLERWFDECDDWEKPPADGVYVVVCDPAALQQFFDGGLESVPPDGPRVDIGQPSGRAITVPAVRRDPNVRNFTGWSISGRARDARVYVACRHDGRVLAATFEDVDLVPGATLQIATPTTGDWALASDSRRLPAPPKVAAGAGGARGGCG